MVSILKKAALNGGFFGIRYACATKVTKQKKNLQQFYTCKKQTEL